MAEEFDRDRVFNIQREYLDRAEKIYKRIRDEVVDYYYDKSPADDGEAREYLDGMRQYLRTSFGELDKLLYDLEDELK